MLRFLCRYLLHNILANRFSKSSDTRMLTTCLQEASSVLKSLVSSPKIKNIVASRSIKLSYFPRLHSFADPTKILLEPYREKAAQ